MQDTSTRKCLLHHGYNAVANDSWRKCRLYITDITLSRMTPGASVVCYITDITLSRMTLSASVVCYIADITLSRMTRVGSHLVPRILHWLLTEKVEKGQILWVHTYPTTSSRPRRRRVQSLVQIGLEMWICISSTQTNIHLYIQDSVAALTFALWHKKKGVGAEVQPHAYTNSILSGSDQLHAPAALP